MGTDCGVQGRGGTGWGRGTAAAEGAGGLMSCVISLCPPSCPVRRKLGLPPFYRRTDPGSERPSRLSQVTQQQRQSQDSAWVWMTPKTVPLSTTACARVASISRRCDFLEHLLWAELSHMSSVSPRAPA